uniref:Brf1 TBP-binding domain-containing protein n=1 Tax=Hippocampus comes TaxID=109280 RepID=A0A3Q2XPH4_HIPCM
TQQNREYLQEQKEKEEQIRREKEDGTYREKKTKKKKKKKEDAVPLATAGEAIKKMLEKKKISAKINYDVLKDLNGGQTASEAAGPPEKAAPVTPARKRRRCKQARGHVRAGMVVSMTTDTTGAGPDAAEGDKQEQGEEDEEERDEDDECVGALQLVQRQRTQQSAHCTLPPC